MIFQDMRVCLKISTISPCSMLDKVLIELGEVYIGIRPTLIPPIIQMIMVDHLVCIVMVITEVDICITPANFMHKKYSGLNIDNPRFTQ